MADPAHPPPTVAILGAGASGICLGAQLMRAGIDAFTIFEKAGAVGGTWRDNTYPGSGCDVPSHLYCFSFAPKHDWSRKFAEQAEILAYLEDCTDRFGLRPHIRFSTEVTRTTFDEDRCQWCVTTADGSEEWFDVLVSATGQLNRPFVPDIDGLDRFRGVSFHSARWDHDHDLTGRDVAVVGSGASAIQFVPEVAKVARRVTIYQRSPNYVVPKPDRAYSRVEKWAHSRFDWVARLHRWLIYWQLEVRFFAFRRDTPLQRRLGNLARRELGKLVSDRLPEQAVIPDYPVGCKRILISNDWYATLRRDHVEVVTEPIQSVTSTGVVAGGRERPADAIVFGTGFESTRFLAPVDVIGVGGMKLHQLWEDGAEAHLGLTVSGFPNFFMLYGPNTNLGHNSILFMVECQVRYILQCLDRLGGPGPAALDLRRDAMARWRRFVDSTIGRTVWADACRSWYKTASGRITNNWPTFSVRYWWATRRPDPDDFELRTPTG